VKAANFLNSRILNPKDRFTSHSSPVNIGWTTGLLFRSSIFLFTTPSRLALGSTQPPTQLASGVLSPEGKASGALS